MRKSFIAACLVISLGSSVFASEDKPWIRKPTDPCLQSKTLRVEIGGEKFAFPREMVRGVKGRDVRNIDDVRRINNDRPPNVTAGGRKACQNPDDPIWQLDSIGLDLYPRPCSDTDLSRCDHVRIDTYVEDLSARRKRGATTVFPDSRQELLKECKPPREPYNNWYAKNWSACDYTFEYQALYIWIKFTGGEDGYSPNEIEETKKAVLKIINKHRIN